MGPSSERCETGFYGSLPPIIEPPISTVVGIANTLNECGILLRRQHKFDTQALKQPCAPLKAVLTGMIRGFFRNVLAVAAATTFPSVDSVFGAPCAARPEVAD